jgi:cyclopropane-fatty-acyl-phospholipid synthase
LARILKFVLKKLIRVGDLRITTVDGSTQRYGDRTGVPAAIRFLSKSAELEVLLYPELHFGEAYMRGDVIVEEGTILDVLAIFIGQPGNTKFFAWNFITKLARPLRRRWQQFNSVRRARRSVKHHYDIDDKLYELFLDADRQYSCAYFEHPNQSLDGAQLAKKRHLAAKLFTHPGQHILEIGCGWGGLAIYLAQTCGAHVLGITLSQKQRALAQKRAAQVSLRKRPEFLLDDYRNVSGRVDRIV